MMNFKTVVKQVLLLATMLGFSLPAIAGGKSLVKKIQEASKEGDPGWFWFRDGNYHENASAARDSLNQMRHSDLRDTGGQQSFQSGDNIGVHDFSNNRVYSLRNGNTGKETAVFSELIPPPRSPDANSMRLKFDGSAVISTTENFKSPLGDISRMTKMYPFMAKEGPVRMTHSQILSGTTPNSDRVIAELSFVREHYEPSGLLILTRVRGNSPPGEREKAFSIFPAGLPGFSPGRVIHYELSPGGQRLKVYTIEKLDSGQSRFHETTLRYEFDGSDGKPDYEVRGTERLTRKRAKELGLIADIKLYINRGSGQRGRGMRRNRAAESNEAS